jgi:hypothetical protein
MHVTEKNMHRKGLYYELTMGGGPLPFHTFQLFENCLVLVVFEDNIITMVGFDVGVDDDYVSVPELSFHIITLDPDIIKSCIW